MATLLPEGKQSFTDGAGMPLVGGKLYTYDAGTSTPRPTYSDAAGTVPNTNPVILDARGEATVFWSGAYKAVLKSATDVTIWTVDGVTTPEPAGSAADLAVNLSSTAPGKGSALIGGFISSDTTLSVPSQYVTIQAALAYLNTVTIARGATVKIQVANGTYTLTSGISANHPQGSQIQILGNQTNPDTCVITVSGVPTFDAFVVSNGHTLGLLDGFRFDLSAKATKANNFTAVLALNGGSIICGPHIKTNNWYYGIAARMGSTVYAKSAVVSNAGDVGIWAFVGSAIDCQNAVVSNCSDSANSLGWGIEAEYGAAIDCSSATVSGCYRGGIGALSGSTVRAISAATTANTGYAGGAHGLYAENGSVIEAHSATTTGNSGFGIHRGTQAMGVVYGNNITNTGNTGGADNTGALFDVTGGQSRVLFYAPSGARIDNANAAPIFFNTAGGAQFEVAHVASAVNHVYVRGAATGSGAEVGATGTDAVIDLKLLPKGAGSFIQFGAGFTASANAPVSGYLQVRDNNGTLRKLAVIS